MTAKPLCILIFPVLLLLLACGNDRTKPGSDSIALRDSMHMADSVKKSMVCEEGLCDLLAKGDSINYAAVEQYLAGKHVTDCNCMFEAEMPRLGSRIPIVKEFMKRKTRTITYAFSPLQFATNAGDTLLMRLLLESGADPDFSDSTFCRPILMALERGNEAAFDLLARYKGSLRGCAINTRMLKTDELRKAAAAGADFNIPEIEYHLDGINTQTGGVKYKKVIRLPVQEVSGAQNLKILLDAGARPDDTATGGVTLLHHVADWGSDDELHLVLRYKPDLYARDHNGKLPLHYAAGNVLPGKLKILLPLYDLQKANVVPDTLLAIATREGNFETADYLRYYFRKKSKI
jgi:hypothetical protein